MSEIKETLDAKETERFRDALELIDVGCTRSSSSRCWKDGKIRGARYADDSWCEPCIARAALDNDPPKSEWKQDWARTPEEMIGRALSEDGHDWFWLDKITRCDLRTDAKAGTVKIDHDLAIRLNVALGKTVEYWEKVQSDYESDVANGAPMYGKRS